MRRSRDKTTASPRSHAWGSALRIALACFLLGAVVAMSGCAGAEIAPATIRIEQGSPAGTGKAAFGSLGMGNRNGGNATFEITAQTIVGKSASFFKVETSCVGTYVVKPEEIKVCKFWVNAVAGSWSSGLTATLQTAWKVDGSAGTTLNTGLLME